MKKVSIARYGEFKTICALRSRYLVEGRYLGILHGHHVYKVIYSNSAIAYYIIVY